jgi:UDP-N-acetylmuramyl pentapeptide phosphotransferase/UDP-N-acetylglucosamine-1-phosphate transferase
MFSIFIAALIISFLVNLIVISLSHKYMFFIDASSSKKPQNFHADSTPRAGGFGILFGMLFLLLAPFGLKLIIPIVLSFLSGIFEDFHNSLSPRFRLALQFVAAISAIYLTDAVVTYLGLGISLPYSIAVIFTAFAIVGMMNAVNMIDGFNGLASGVVLLILLSFGYTSYQENNTELLLVIIVALGAILGFLLLNYPKGKIFLGDGGAYALGFIIALIGIFLVSRYESVSPWYILAVFIYPVWEVCFSIIRKLAIGLSPMQPDRYHLHMLVYRKITQNNPRTSLYIILAIAPFTLFSTLYPANSLANILTIALFIPSYLIVYRYLRTKENP